MGNRETMEDGSGTTAYDYDDADQLTSVTPPGQQAIEYSWDDNGNLLERGADTYDWDAADRMTSATVGSVTTDMAYNGVGLRDSRTMDENAVTFTWDVNRSIPQVIDDGSLGYVYGLGRVSQVGAAGTFYYLSDGLGSTMALTDASGNVVNTYNYDVFGAVRASTGSQPNEFLFTGEQRDSSTGLEYLRARYYDPAIGRFLSRDPWPGQVRNPQTQHAYAYVLGNPCNLADPWGLGPVGIFECVSWIEGWDLGSRISVDLPLLPEFGTPTLKLFRLELHVQYYQEQAGDVSPISLWADETHLGAGWHIDRTSLEYGKEGGGAFARARFGAGGFNPWSVWPYSQNADVELRQWVQGQRTVAGAEDIQWNPFQWPGLTAKSGMQCGGFKRQQ